MLQQHVEQKADVTVGCLEMPRSESSAFGIIDVDENDVIRSFLEKPADPPPMPGKPHRALRILGQCQGNLTDRWPVWESISSIRSFFSISCGGTRVIQIPATILART